MSGQSEPSAGSETAPASARRRKRKPDRRRTRQRSGDIRTSAGGLEFPYAVDYNDHFETSATAYRDVLPVLDALCARAGNGTRAAVRLYDPYYCNGRTKLLLRRFGFQQVVHEKRDFYKDVDDGTVPQHDVFLTNPPYSDTHKERCLGFCVERYRDRDTPFLLLMPSYVATRSYFTDLTRPYTNDIIYVVPSERYEYDHPEGTGHATSPFHSVWFCCVGAAVVETVREHIESAVWSDDRNKPQIIDSLAGLERLGIVSTQKRPNPRQRKKRRKAASQSPRSTFPRNQTTNRSGDDGPTPTSKLDANTVATKKTSKYRDENGRRKQKRF